jgi:hypothetical protein
MIWAANLSGVPRGSKKEPFRVGPRRSSCQHPIPLIFLVTILASRPRPADSPQLRTLVAAPGGAHGPRVRLVDLPAQLRPSSFIRATRSRSTVSTPARRPGRFPSFTARAIPALVLSDRHCDSYWATHANTDSSRSYMGPFLFRPGLHDGDHAGPVAPEAVHDLKGGGHSLPAEAVQCPHPRTSCPTCTRRRWSG